MKTNIFDFKRFGLLFQRYFAERSHTELIYWSIMAIVFMFIRNNPPFTLLFIIIAGAIYAARFFREIHSRSNGVSYFMIPATQLEKLIVGIIMTTVYYFAMMVIVYVIGNLVGTFLNNMIAGINVIPFVHHSSLEWQFFMSGDDNGGLVQTFALRHSYVAATFRTFLFFQSIFLLGSIYFKNNQAGKTFFTAFVITLLLLILLIIEARLFGVSDLEILNIQLSPSSAREWGMTTGRILRHVRYLLPPFLWVVSYFRLTEKQI